MAADFEAERMKDIPFSNIRQVFERVNQLKTMGVSAIPFHIGQPDFDTPEHIKEAAKDALDQGLTAYTSNYGLPNLRKAVAEKLATENCITVDPDTQVIITVGANEAVLMAMMATLNPGDEVLIPDPMWLHYFYCARLVGARVISVPLRPENKFQLDPDDLQHALTPRAKMIVINSPHNPTGVIFNRETIQAIAVLVEKHNLIVLSDEIYEKMIYDGLPHFSPGSIETIQDQTITVNGFSKTYAMTGWRVGYAAASPSLIGSMVRAHQYSTICATSFAQAGALAALKGPQDSARYMIREFAQRRDEVVERLQQIHGISLVPPQGAFYAFPDVSAWGPSSESIAERLLAEVSVAVIPGRAFGVYGEGFLRLSFACSLPQIKKGLQAMARFGQQIRTSTEE
jgi:aminotransferase